MLSPNLTTDHRRSMTNQTPSHAWQILSLGFPNTSRCPFASPRDSLESRSLSPKTSMLHGLIAGGGCITLKTKTRWSATLVHQLATLKFDAAFITKCYTNWEDATRKKAGFSQHEIWPVSPGSCREEHRPSCHDQGCRREHQPMKKIKIIIIEKL